MTLQKVLLPKPELCMEEALYFRRSPEGIAVDLKLETIQFQKDAYVNFDTYFNGFSIGKWKKYTVLKDLQLRITVSGRFTVRIYNHELVNQNIITSFIMEKHVGTQVKKDFVFSFEGFAQKGMHAFSIVSESNGSVFYGGEYFSDEDQELSDVRMVLNMCTFKKEKFIYRNLDTLRAQLLENPESPFYQKLDFYITDNAMTIDEGRLDSPFIHIKKQNAFGSAGGFTRGLLGILDDKGSRGYTHALFLDDDILIDPQVLCRTLVFLRYVKPEYRDAWLGGGMLGLDFSRIQAESGGCIDKTGYTSLKPYSDMGDLYLVLRNDIEEGAKINAWWYCCIPLSTLDENHLPYPVYFHCDDMEYASRLCKKLILLNGICVWHEEFFYKPDAHYYDKRNFEILYSLHYPNLSKRRNAKKRLFLNVIRELLSYRYRNAEDILNAIEDFLKGPQWLVATDDRSMFNCIAQNRFEYLPVEQLPMVFNYDQFIQSQITRKESRIKHIIRLATLNGWLLPANREAIVSAAQPIRSNFYRAKRVLNYAVNTNTGYITHKSYKKAFHIMVRLFRLLLKMDFKYSSICKSYRESLMDFTTRSFWEQKYKQ